MTNGVDLRWVPSVVGEEASEEFGAFICQDPTGHLWPVIQPAVSNDVPQAPDRTGFVVERAEHDSSYPRLHRSPRTHCAWLEGDHQRAVI